MNGCWASITSAVLLTSALTSMGLEKTNDAATAQAGGHLESISIHQEIDFTNSPQWLYEALLDANRFTAFSGRKAEIKRESGGAFSLFDAHIVGRNVDSLPHTRIVQPWRVVTWPEGVYSVVRFEFEKRGYGTHLVFDHVGFPKGLHD